MKEDDLIFISQNKRWPFGFDIITDYITIYILPSFIAVVALAFLFMKKDSSVVAGVIYVSSIFLLMIAYLLAKFLRKRMDAGISFFEIAKPMGGMDTIVQASESLNWQIEEFTNTYLIAHTRMTAFSWGETITIILNDHCMLFNSRPTMQPLTLNRREIINLNKFMNSLNMR